ncbi:MAG TPA: hemolysin III family protein [Gemmatimonadales bacterium]|nr:hemolysin III family protein [Gemmatimonadales bacterium]
MNTVPPVREPRQSLGEEIANSISHGVGLLAALLAVPFLIGAAVRRAGTSGIIGTSVFAATIVILYLASTLYHALPPSKAKRVFRVLDYGAVFLLIAGTYTPFTLGVLRGAWGWTLFGLVWSLAVLGIVLTAVGGIRFPRLAIGVYLGMGWLVLIAIRPLWLRVPLPGLLWLLAGGLAYTAGVPFLAAQRVRYGHFLWHLLVLVGTSCHFIAVLSYAA